MAGIDLTQTNTRKNQTSDQAVDCKVGENFSWEPQPSQAGIVECRMACGQGRDDVLVQRGHDDDGERGVEQVVAPDEYCIKNALQDRSSC